MNKFNISMTRRITAAALVGVMVVGTAAYGVNAATEHFNDATTVATNSEWTQWKSSWTAISDDYEKISVNVGADESQLGFAFYQHTSDTPKVRYATSKSALSSAKEFTGTVSTTDVKYSDSLKESLTKAGKTLTGEETYSAAKVTITGLKDNTKYYYQVYQNGTWSETKTYTTKDSSSYSVLYVADPQIGASKGQADSEGSKLADDDKGTTLAARNDSYNWNNILTNTLKEHSDVSFILSAGDQVNTSKYEYEYAGFLNPSALSSIALSTAIGNHDSSNYNYSNHFNNPNSFDITSETDTTYTAGHTKAGSDYYYRYGDALYIVLDTNNYNCATHENVIKKAISENKDATWRIVCIHQDIYGSGYDHSDSDGIVLRTQLTPIFDEYDIDAVLQGHDHTYSRSYQISSDGKEHTSYDSSNWRESDTFATENQCYNLCSTSEDGNTLINPKGTVYFEQNSATGSKFYELIANQQDFISERSQTWTPTYSIMNVSKNELSITTYDASTGKQLEGSSTYTIKKASVSTPSVKKLTSTTKGKVTVQLNAVKGATGYQIYTSTDGKKFTKAKTVKSAAKLTLSAKSGKKLYVKVRAYKKVSGKNVFSSYSKVKSVKVK